MIKTIALAIIFLLVLFALGIYFATMQVATTSIANSYQMITGLVPTDDLKIHESGFEDFTGWYRTQISWQEAQRVALRLEAEAREELTRAQCLQNFYASYQPPVWWLAVPDGVGRCWVKTGTTSGGVVVHYMKSSQIVAILVFTT